MPRGRPKLTWIEAAIVLCLLGTTLAVFVPSFLRRVRTNKINEASELLQEMSHRAASYYGTPWGPMKEHCLPPKAGPTPTEPTMEPAAVDFSSNDVTGHSTWVALGFQPERPVRYSYSYTPDRDGCGLVPTDPAISVLYRAEGDLDGDGVRSTFERSATVGPEGLESGDVLRVHPRIE